MIFAKFISFICTISAIALVAVAVPLDAAQKREALNVAVCTDRSVKLTSHDCNVALLKVCIRFQNIPGPDHQVVILISRNLLVSSLAVELLALCKDFLKDSTSELS